MDKDTLVLLEKILKDESHPNPESKLRRYASECEFNELLKTHPMMFVYCCASNGNIDECVRLLATISEFYNFETPKASSEDIYELISFVLDESKTNSTLKVIFDAEIRYLQTIKAVPVLFFKASVDKGKFDIDQLKNMLKIRNRMESNGLSQHDASVSVGTLLVDKYVKPHLK